MPLPRGEKGDGQNNNAGRHPRSSRWFRCSNRARQLRVDALPPEKFHPLYSDSLWRAWRRDHITYITLTDVRRVKSLRQWRGLIKLAAIDTVRLFGEARPIFPRVIEQS